MKKQNMPAMFAGIGLIILILDTKTAIRGAAEGMEICLQTLIPSLLPFLFLSGFMTASLQGKPIRILRPIGKLLRIPTGAESIFLIGLLAGYPVGAQCVAQAVRGGCISRENGKRMLAFCSNAGPAFLFGIGSRLFSEIWMVWALWLIHITSAILVGMMTFRGNDDFVSMQTGPIPAPTAVLRQALQTMAMICGWVVLLRVLMSFLQRWFAWCLPDLALHILSGLLEIANGFCGLSKIVALNLRFILCSAFLGFGGLCVTMQTYSVCAGLDCSLYLPGKLLQTVFSILLSSMVISREMRLTAAICLALICCALYSFRQRSAKKDSNLHKCVV